jgi:hypothetical protein
MLLSFAIFLLLIACFLVMGALVVFCESVIASSQSPITDTSRPALVAAVADDQQSAWRSEGT